VGGIGGLTRGWCRGGALEEQMKKFEEEKARWEKDKNKTSTGNLDVDLAEARAKAMQEVDREILELLPKVGTLRLKGDQGWGGVGVGAIRRAS
jgi:hypothetical protein